MVRMIDSDGYCLITAKVCDRKRCEMCDEYKEYKTGWRYGDDGELCEGRY